MQVMLNHVFLCVVYTQLLHITNCLVDKSKSQIPQELLRTEAVKSQVHWEQDYAG